MRADNSHCSNCGAPFALHQTWPRTCAQCGAVTYRNPLPVAVVIVPTDRGVVLIRRGLGPGRGRWALPGGYIEVDETWQEAGSREVFEETGIIINPVMIEGFTVRSAPDGVLLVFGVAAAMRAAELPTFTPRQEASERILATAPPEDMAFPLHRDALESFLAERTP